MKTPKTATPKIEEQILKTAERQSFWAGKGTCEDPEDTFRIPVSRKELDTLWNAARALDLINNLSHADGDQAIVTVQVLLDMCAESAYQVSSDLQFRFEDEQRRAAERGQKVQGGEA
jgi:hypothetical protein